MDVPETVDPKEVQPVTQDSLEEAARAVFGEPDEPEKPAEEAPKAEERDEKGRFKPKTEAEAKPKLDEEPKGEDKAEDPRVAARINAAKRAELRAAQERAEIQRERAELQRMKDEVAQLAKLAEQVKAAKGSPSRLLELAEQDPKSFLESLATEHEPQAIAQRVRSEVQTEVEALKAQISELRAAREQERAAFERQQAEAQIQKAQSAFLEHIAEKAETYPHLVEEFTPDEIASRALALAQEHSQSYYEKFGFYPDDEVFAEELERQARERAESRAAWRSRIGKSAITPGKGDSSGDTRSRPTVKADSPRTLTSRAASTKATPPREWSQEDADAEALRILESAFAAKRAG